MVNTRKQAAAISLSAAALLVVAAAGKICKKKRRKKRCAWVRELLQQRESNGAYFQLMRELRESDPKSYKNYVRMDVETFEWLLEKVRPHIQKKTTFLRKPISASECLAVTLRFLATGESYASLEFQFRISKSFLCLMIPNVCQAIFSVLQNEFLSCPQIEHEWLKIAEEFQERWQLPNCVGAGDGKHIRILCPKNSGSHFFNYKGYFSIVLMAFVGPNYEFLFVDVGCQGSISDGGVYRQTDLYKSLERNELYLPPARPLPSSPDPLFEEMSNINLEHYFVCDEAFPLSKNLMKPYPRSKLTEEKRVFNYRLSRARRVSENAFGILAARFRILHTMMCLHPDRAKYVILACCALHNLLLSKATHCYCPPGSMDYDGGDEGCTSIVPGSWRKEVGNLANFESLPKCKERYAKNADEMRSVLCNYVNGPGSVPWQWKALVV